MRWLDTALESLAVADWYCRLSPTLKALSMALSRLPTRIASTPCNVYRIAKTTSSGFKQAGVVGGGNSCVPISMTREGQSLAPKTKALPIRQ